MHLARKSYHDGSWGQIHLRSHLPQGPSARPLLLIHQTPKSGWIWEPLFPFFADRPVLAPDTPGYGASDPPPAPWDIEDMAEELGLLVTGLRERGSLGAEPIDVLGYHTGSVLAVALARQRSDLVGNIICASLPFYSPQERARRAAALPDTPSLLEDGSHLLKHWSLVGGLTDARAGLAWRQASFAENLRSGERQLWGYRAVYRYDLAAALEDLKRPLLLLNPEDDLFDPTREARTYLPDAHYCELPGLSHGLFQLAGERIAQMVRAFVDSERLAEPPSMS